MPKTKRLLLVASAGGHWIQLSRMRRAFAGHDCLYATTMQGMQPPSGMRPVSTLSDASRSSPHKIPLLLLQLLWIMVRFRPQVVVSTGAAPGLIAIFIGKCAGARTVWIDSLANAHTLSLSGRLAGKFADLWLTQWPELTPEYPNLKCYGAVF